MTEAVAPFSRALVSSTPMDVAERASPKEVEHEPVPTTPQDRPAPVAIRNDPERARPTMSRWLSIPAAGLGGIGVLVLAFGGYLLGFTNLQAARAQQHLASALVGPAGLAALTGKVPAEGQPVALLEIPSLHLKQVVVQGTSARDLENGPGLMLGTAPPGTAGDTVIAGRRATFGAPFANLGSLRSGTLVRITGGLGSFSYRISRIETISVGQVEPIGATTTARLTLVTSNPPISASGLLIAVATLVGRPVATVPTYAVGPPPPNFGLTGDPAASTPALLAGEGFLVVAIGTFVAYRRWRHFWATYLLALPLLLALLVMCFENIAALLPATL